MLANEHLEVYSRICYLTDEETKDYAQLLQYGDELDLNVKRKFLWVWPQQEDLINLKNLFKFYNIDCILSIGCGNGLLEWILTESLGLEIYGLEVDRRWWQSAYSVKSFIKLNYAEDIQIKDKQQFLLNCCHTNEWKFALLFCYFNNRKAFLNYLDMYQGDKVIIIGPSNDAGIHTDPSPLQPQFPQGSSWHLKHQLELGSNDVIVLYEKAL